MSIGTIITWHVGHVGADLARMLPGWRLVTMPSPTAPATRPVGRVVLVGYSAGCAGVREALRGPVPSPDAVVTIDGTHSLKGPGAPVHPIHAALWRDLAARARRGDLLWVATTLGQHRYTERLPGGEAYASTGRVLEVALGLPDGALRREQTIIEGGLVVRSYPSADMDAPAHAAQVRSALPALWSDVVVPHLTGARHAIADDPTPVPDTEPAPPPEPHGHVVPARPLGLRALDVAREHLARGIREVPGPTSHPQILAYHYPARRGGTPVAGILDATGSRLGLASESHAWCAAFSSFCLALAIDGTDERDREACPHGYRVSVAELVADARARGTWRDAGAHRPELGDLAIWTRAGGDPRRGGTGHVARVSRVDGSAFVTIDGNGADAVRETSHRLGEPGLVGWILGERPAPAAAVA